MNTSNDPKNTIILHYEELAGTDIVVKVTPHDVADFICLKKFKHGVDELKNSKDFTFRVIGSSFEDCLNQFDDLLEISRFLGWFEIIGESEEFYEYEKKKRLKEAGNKLLKGEMGL
jgi:hypothetical protein